MNHVHDPEKDIIGIWTDLFPEADVKESSHFFELGGDSLTAINMSLAVEQKTGFIVPLGTIYKAPVLSEFITLVSTFEQEEKRPIVTPIQVKGTRTPLFAIAPAIGGAFHYREFSNYIKPDQPCYCLEPRISSLGKHNYLSVEEIAEWQIKAIKNIQAEGPYRLCGYSFGGSIAWEIAKQLKAKGDEVDLLLLYDTIARGEEFYKPRPELSIAERLKWVVSKLNFFRDTYRRYDAHLNYFNVISLIGVKFNYLANSLYRRLAGRREETASLVAAHMENEVQNKLRCVYQYGTYDGELILLRAKKQLLLRRELNYELGWTNRPLSGLKIIDVPGDHLTMMYGEPAKEIVRQTNLLIDALDNNAEKAGIESPMVESLPFIESGITSPVDRFREIVGKYGGRQAVLDEGRFYSYNELDDLSDRLASCIMNQLGSSSSGVAVYLNNSYEMCAVFLAVLKSGNYYVPLDPEHPEDRTLLIVEQAGVDMIISDDSLDIKSGNLFGKLGIQMVSIDQLDLSSCTLENKLSIEPSSRAIILFTSGSTGNPKGVLHNHRSVSYVGWRRGSGIDLKPTDRYLSVYSGSFMGFLNGFYASLQFGSCFCFYRLRQQGIKALVPWLNANKITIFHSVTSVYRRFVNSLDKDTVLTSVRSVTPGGEPSRQSDIERFKTHFVAGTVYYSNLGSSETGSIAFDPIYHDTVVPQQIPVGIPFEELNLSIQDSEGNSCDPGVEGEICLSTENIFSGYWQDEEKTNEVFTNLSNGSRLFRSGDFGYIRVDGRLVNLGRKDNQVKINGYRMEIPDVESSFMKLPQISEIAIIVREDATADNALRLYAFYRLKNDFSKTSKEDIREALLEDLPTAMIPNYLFEVQSLPTNPTGKIDRKFLTNIPLEHIDF